jgi:hypothetical protein
LTLNPSATALAIIVAAALWVVFALNRWDRQRRRAMPPDQRQAEDEEHGPW